MASVMIVAAHPDDEVLGCGGTAARHASEGDDVHVLILTRGITGRPGASPAEVEALADAARHANDLLGVRSLALHDYPDQRLDSLPRLEVTQLIESHIQNRSPAIVYTHFWADCNMDHTIVSECTATACRPTPSSTVRRLLFFEVPSSTEWAIKSSFRPDWFVDVSSTFGRKLEALKMYASEMRPFPHPRSEEAIANLAGWRGAAAGVGRAEAFALARNVER